MYIPSAGSPWGPPRRDSCPRVRNASERTNEEDDVVSQALGGSPILDATGAPSLCDWSTIGIQKALKYAKPNVGGVVQVWLRDELRGRAGTGKGQVPQDRRDGVRDDHPSSVPCRMTKDIVNVALPAKFDAVDRDLE